MTRRVGIVQVQLHVYGGLPGEGLVCHVGVVSCAGPACVLFELGLKFWSQGGQLFGAFACGVGGFARASLMVKAWRCGNLADAGVGGLGFDGAFQAKERCARNIVVKSEAVHKRGARWRCKLKVDQRARGAHFEMCRHESLKAHAMEPCLGGQCAWRHVKVADSLMHWVNANRELIFWRLSPVKRTEQVQ